MFGFRDLSDALKIDDAFAKGKRVFNDIIGTKRPEGLGGGNASRACSDNHKPFHGHTSLTSMAFLGRRPGRV